MKNYKVIIFILLITLLSLFLYFYLNGISGGNNNNTLSGASDSLNNSAAKTQLELECKKIIEGKQSNIIAEKGRSIIKYYEKAINISKNLSTNSYLAFEYIKKGDCEKLDTQKNVDFCNSIKSGKVYGVEGEYEYYFSKSIIEGKSSCTELEGERSKNDCENNFLYYQDSSKKIEKNNILEMTSVEMSKTYNDLGKSKYIEKLNEDFMSLCLKLSME